MIYLNITVFSINALQICLLIIIYSNLKTLLEQIILLSKLEKKITENSFPLIIYQLNGNPVTLNLKQLYLKKCLKNWYF